MDAKIDDITFFDGDTVFLTAEVQYSDSYYVSKYRELIIMADIENVAGGTIDLILQVSIDNSFWVDQDQFKQITATGYYEKRFTNFGRWIRLEFVPSVAATLGSNGIVGSVKT